MNKHITSILMFIVALAILLGFLLIDVLTLQEQTEKQDKQITELSRQISELDGKYNNLVEAEKENN